MTAAQHPSRDDATGEQVALAIDLGGTKVEAGLVTADGEVRIESVNRAPTGRERSTDEIIDAVRRVAASALSTQRSSDQLLGAGIGSAGPVDLVAGTASPLNLPAAERLPLVAVVQELIDAPVRLALDGTCIALAEHAFGAARGARNALAMVVSTGIGGGLIIDGMPVTGVSGNAGHLGQTRLRGRSDADDATVGTLEAIASGPSSVAWARSQGWVGETGEALAEAYAAGEPVAVAAVRRSAGAVGEAIASTSTLLDLDTAVIAGGFAAVARDYLDLVRASADANTVFAYAKRVRIVASGLDGRGPLIGAAALALR